MRKIVSLMHMSLDGFVADTEGSLSWVSLPPDMYKEVMQSIHKVDTAIYGRVVYYMMKNYWPTLLEKENVDEVSLDHAKWVQDVKKIVFSKTINEELWNNTIQIKDNIKEEITKLKNEEGKDMMIFGSPSIVQEFIRLNLLDELRIFLNPVILGEGTPMFKDVDMTKLNLIESKVYDSAVIKLIYKIKK
ncbi:MAG: dihydrofolate reductase [Bacteroidetes bacterium]|nr:dihydrofolate reductase [Bacteroidota bacterium]